MLYKVMTEKRLSLRPTPPSPRPVEDNALIPVPSPPSPNHLSTITYGSSESPSLVAGPSNSSQDSSKSLKAISAQAIESSDLEDSVDVTVDGQPDQARSRHSRHYAAYIAKDWATTWREAAKPANEITDQALQVYYLAQKLRWSFEDISLALRIANIENIVQSLLSLTKLTKLSLDEEVYHESLLRICFDERADRMSADTKALLKPNMEALQHSRNWSDNFREGHRVYLQAYSLQRRHGLSLEEVAVTLGMNYRVVARFILISVILLGRKLALSSLRELVMDTQNAYVHDWFTGYVKNNAKIQQQLGTAGLEEDCMEVRVETDDLTKKDRKRMRRALDDRLETPETILRTPISPEKLPPKPREVLERANRRRALRLSRFKATTKVLLIKRHRRASSKGRIHAAKATKKGESGSSSMVNFGQKHNDG